MSHSLPKHWSSQASCSTSMEEALNLYVDGELAVDDEAMLFSHLAVCARCRRTLNAVLAFRRMSRQEPLAVPPAADERFFQRLDQLKRRATDRVDRTTERLPLWQARTVVSLRLAAAVAFILFMAGLLFPTAWSDGPVSTERLVEGVQEQVEFISPIPHHRETVYVFYPGLTVESTRLDKLSTSEAL